MINSFDVLKSMCERSMSVWYAPLSNVLRARKVKAGTQLTFGVGGDFVAVLLDRKVVGGLVLADKEQFDLVKSELELEQAQTLSAEGAGTPTPKKSSC